MRSPAADVIDQQWSYSVRAARQDSYDVNYRRDLLSLKDPTLADALRPGASVLVVTTPSVDRLYGDRLRAYLAAHASQNSFTHMVLPCSEADKSFEKVLSICHKASDAGLARQSQVVCVGGGVLLDIAGLAATLFRRGVPHIRVPTTLIGMIDAAIGVKNAVNYNQSKSLLGTFTPPEACFIDPSFLATLPRRHLQCGLAELIKIAVMCSSELFQKFEARADQLLLGATGIDIDLSSDLIQLGAYWTLKELELNLFERRELFEEQSYARKLDFGHTFSPMVETSSGHSILHGEAVAIDMAICAELAYRMQILNKSARTRILDALLAVDLPIHLEGLEAGELHASLESVVRHRDGNLNLPLPSDIGSAVFVKDLRDVSATLLREALETLGCYAARRDHELDRPQLMHATR